MALKKKNEIPLTNLGAVSTKIALSNRKAEKRRNKSEMKSVKVHEVLCNLMKSKGLTARALSKKIGIPASTLSSYLSGKKASYAPEHIGVLCEFFQVSSDYLLFGESTNNAALGELQFQEIFNGLVRIKVEKVTPGKKEN